MYFKYFQPFFIAFVEDHFAVKIESFAWFKIIIIAFRVSLRYKVYFMKSAFSVYYHRSIFMTLN